MQRDSKLLLIQDIAIFYTFCVIYVNPLMMTLLHRYYIVDHCLYVQLKLIKLCISCTKEGSYVVFCLYTVVEFLVFCFSGCTMLVSFFQVNVNW